MRKLAAIIFLCITVSSAVYMIGFADYSIDECGRSASGEDALKFVFLTSSILAGLMVAIDRCID